MGSHRKIRELRSISRCVASCSALILFGCKLSLEPVVESSSPMTVEVQGSVQSDGAPVSGASLRICGRHPTSIFGVRWCGDPVESDGVGSYSLAETVDPSRCPISLTVHREGFLGEEVSLSCVEGPQTRPISLEPTSSLVVEAGPGAMRLGVGSTLGTCSLIRRQSGERFPGTVTWSSGTPEVAAVDRSGTVTGVSAGAAVLRAEYREVFDSVLVTVQASPSRPTGPVAYVTHLGVPATVDLETGDVLGPPYSISDSGRVSLSPDGGLLFLSNWQKRSVSAWDPDGSRRIQGWELGWSPRSVIASSDNSWAYIFGDSDGVAVLDLESHQLVESVPAGGSPLAAVLGPDGSKGYFALPLEDAVSVLDLNARSLLTSVDVDGRAQGVASTPDGSIILVSLWDKNAVVLLDAGADTLFTSRITVGRGPGEIAVSPDGTQAYVANADSKTVSRIDLTQRTVAATITLPDRPWGLEVSRDGEVAYVSHGTGISKIDLDTDQTVGPPLEVCGAVELSVRYLDG